MKPITRLIVPVFAVLFAIPTMAMPQGRRDDRDWDRSPGYGRIMSKQEAYREGYGEGYRDGLRQGRRDYLEHRRFKNKARELAPFRWESNPRFWNDFKKGYKNGYKEGYRDAYQGRRMDRRY